MVKRAFDLVVALAAAIVLLPVMAVVAILIAWKLGRPVLFRHERPGLHGKPFKLVKFRTLGPGSWPDGTIKDDRDRMTPLGRVLRTLSLDELPGLWNVIKGEMSLVGPRPLLMQYLPLYSPRQARRHEVRPGITGLAQVSGRNALGWDAKFELDVRYVEQHNLRMDLHILALTVLKVFRRDGISAPGEATMPIFTGSAGERERER